jgi:hypothetical protein
MTKQLTAFEDTVLRSAVLTLASPEWRDKLLEQLDKSTITDRSEDAFGYYVDFDVPAELRIPELVGTDRTITLIGEFGATQAQPDLQVFVAYVRDGGLHFLEASSTLEWPYDVVLDPGLGSYASSVADGSSTGEST